MKLTEFVAYYADNSLERLSMPYIEQLRVSVNLLERYMGMPVQLEDLSDGMVNRFVDSLYDSGRSPDTVRTRRGSILALWRAAFDHHLVDTPPLRIRKLRRTRRITRAWPHDDVRTLLRVAAKQRGTLLNGIARDAYWISLIATAWDTALRLGDLLRLQYADIPQGNRWIVMQHKTKDEVVVAVQPQTRLWINKCYCDLPHRKLMWPLWGSRNAFYRAFRNLVAEAKITPGTFKYLRRSSITNVVASGGNGSTHAGHRSTQVTAQNYTDMVIVQATKRDMPTSLWEEEK